MNPVCCRESHDIDRCVTKRSNSSKKWTGKFRCLWDGGWGCGCWFARSVLEINCKLTSARGCSLAERYWLQISSKLPPRRCTFPEAIALRYSLICPGSVALWREAMKRSLICVCVCALLWRDELLTALGPISDWTYLMANILRLSHWGEPGDVVDLAG